jgi:hypothetical protein
MILLTGGDDDDQPAHISDALNAPSTLHWFAQNRASTRDHPKVSLTPGGINLYEHLWINNFIMLQHLRNQFTPAVVAAESGAGAAASAAPSPCALLDVAQTQQLLVDLEHCVDETMECSVELQRTRMIIGLDEVRGGNSKKTRSSLGRKGGGGEGPCLVVPLSVCDTSLMDVSFPFLCLCAVCVVAVRCGR